jgi:hypothetical protein
MTVRNQYLMHKKINRSLNMGNACYHSIQNLLSAPLLSKNIKIRLYKSIILSVVLYVCEIWSFILRKEHRLKMFENRVLRRMFQPKRNEVIAGGRKLHNVELHNLYPSPSTIGMMKTRRMRWAGHVAQMGRSGMHIGYWWQSQKEKKTLGRYGWADSIKMDLREIAWSDMDWIALAQDRDQRGFL